MARVVFRPLPCLSGRLPWAWLLVLLAGLTGGARADTAVLVDGRVVEAEAATNAPPTSAPLIVHQAGTVLSLPRARVQRMIARAPQPASGAFSDGASVRASAPRPSLAVAAQPPQERAVVRQPWPEAGRIVLKRGAAGDYYRYIPRRLRQPVSIAFLFHGTPEPGDTALDVARQLIQRSHWVPLAEEQGVVLCAVAFDDERFFGSRYLEGNTMPADAFVLDLYRQFDEEFGGVDPRFYLYGHSAGAQFAERFALKHPEHVARAVLSAAGTYAYPDARAEWPFGMRGAPNPLGFVEAAALPVTVVVGRNDVEPVPLEELQRGPNRIVRAEAWVDEMRQLAERNGRRPGVQLVVVEGLDHTSSALSAEAVRYLFR